MTTNCTTFRPVASRSLPGGLHVTPRITPYQGEVYIQDDAVVDGQPKHDAHLGGCREGLMYEKCGVWRGGVWRGGVWRVMQGGWIAETEASVPCNPCNLHALMHGPSLPLDLPLSLPPLQSQTS